MDRTIVSGILKQRKNKSHVTLNLYVTPEDMEKYLLEKGEQPEGMIKINIIPKCELHVGRRR